MVGLSEYQKMVKIASEEAHKLNVSLLMVLGKSRQMSIAQARHKAMDRMYKELPLSYAEVASFFDRCHTTVMYAVEKLNVV